ncbi:MAG: hypothetical protein U0936_03095 [Planctomycetaceae bacterium]
MSTVCLPIQPSIMNSDAQVLADDIAAFGMAAAVALAQLPPTIADLNRTYRQLVSARALSVMPEIQPWVERTVNVFLRHDNVFVFAIHCSPQVGMTNAVELCEARFVVDETGRQQTLRKEGTLPNLSTVHAFVTGRVCNLSDEAPDVVLSDWHPVLYRPDIGTSFMTTSLPGPIPANVRCELQPVHTADRVLMIPGKIKVWCQGPSSEILRSCDLQRKGELE